MWYLPSKYRYAMCNSLNVTSTCVCVNVHKIIICHSTKEHYSDSKLCWTIKILIILKFRSYVDSEDYAGIRMHVLLCVRCHKYNTEFLICKNWYAVTRETDRWSKYFFGYKWTPLRQKKKFYNPCLFLKYFETE